MIIPVRCFTCNKVLADAWEKFVEMCAKETEKKSDKEGLSQERLKEILKQLGFTRICCNRHMLTHVDLLEHI